MTSNTVINYVNNNRSTKMYRIQHVKVSTVTCIWLKYMFYTKLRASWVANMSAVCEEHHKDKTTLHSLHENDTYIG